MSSLGRFRSTSSKKKKARPSWRDEEEAPSSKKPRESEAMAKLKAELSERDRIAEKRRRELDKSQKILDRTRGDVPWEAVRLLYGLDLAIGKHKGRLVFELFDDVVPRTVKCFLNSNLAEETKLRVSDVAVEGTLNTRGVQDDENYTLKHTNAGVVSMSSRGNNNFQISLGENKALDGKRVVFGRLVHGFAILRALASHGKDTVAIVGSGLLQKKHDLDATLAAADDDVALGGGGTSLALVLGQDGGGSTNKKKSALDKARTYRNKANYYDTSARSALFSWTTSAKSTKATQKFPELEFGAVAVVGVEALGRDVEHFMRLGEVASAFFLEAAVAVGADGERLELEVEPEFEADDDSPGFDGSEHVEEATRQLVVVDHVRRDGEIVGIGRRLEKTPPGLFFPAGPVELRDGAGRLAAVGLDVPSQKIEVNVRRRDVGAEARGDDGGNARPRAELEDSLALDTTRVFKIPVAEHEAPAPDLLPHLADGRRQRVLDSYSLPPRHHQIAVLVFNVFNGLHGEPELGTFFDDATCTSDNTAAVSSKSEEEAPSS
eukprot:CAMPEP_0118905980 /NCGR_PEP_ID=MMETSP1166-20130328/9713_1 /TAXON_ID=1104430 /ORGANISM="Chrysoreinhardia sp, Strain CCMP3193" /LENGTH=548 /DNA_ID=CAMNT_0006845251 /DNA_START=21 /DNA_END=1665 /DNA_ORIENTATION=+